MLNNVLSRLNRIPIVVLWLWGLLASFGSCSAMQYRQQAGMSASQRMALEASRETAPTGKPGRPGPAAARAPAAAPEFGPVGGFHRDESGGGEDEIRRFYRNDTGHDLQVKDLRDTVWLRVRGGGSFAVDDFRTAQLQTTCRSGDVDFVRKYGTNSIVCAQPKPVPGAMPAPTPNEQPAVTGNRAAVLKQMITVMRAQIAYSSKNGGALGRLQCLASPVECGFPPETPPFLDPDLAALTVSHGYVWSVVEGKTLAGSIDKNGIDGFLYGAVPVVPGPGTYGFATDVGGAVCFTEDGSLPPTEGAKLGPDCRVIPWR